MAFSPRLLQQGASGAGGSRARSLRFNGADTTYLNRTPASAGNRRTWTWSGWVKRSALSAGNYPQLMSADGGTYGSKIGYFYDETLFVDVGQGATYTRLTSTAVYRDVSAWYHVVVAQDTTQATDTNRVKVYINGSQITLSGTYPTQNFDGSINNNSAQNIGRESTATYYFNGYMTEVYMIDGQALTPSSFGETDASTGVWKPKTYSGSYGTNGFKLNFSDNSGATATTLGRDYSGNGNNFTPNNFSVASGVGNDSVVDVPTSSGTDTGVGGEVRGNYCTLNPLFIPLGTTYYSITNGNLTVTGTGTPNSGDVIGTISTGFTGKYYFESTVTGIDALGYVQVGASDVQQTMDALSYNYLGYLSKSYSYNSSGTKSNNSASTVYGSSFTTGDVIGIAIDCDNGAIYFSKNNTWQTSGVPTSGASKTGAAFTWTGGTQNMIPQIAVYRTGSIADNNFGQRAFAYTAPTGFKTLCTQNLATPTIGATSATQAGKYFNTSLYTGTGSNLAITGVGFQPDWLWIKHRSGTDPHTVLDVLRGVDIGLTTNTNAAEVDFGVPVQLSFDSDGFTLGTNGRVNTSAQTYVAWNWNAGGSTVTNTSGSVSAQVRANPTAGFSIVTFSGNSTNGTVGHGLGVVPSMVIWKQRNAIEDWQVYHVSLGNANSLRLNSTNASAGASAWQSVTPTSSVVYLGAGSTNQTGQNNVMYCFAPIAGYSAFGIYRGNGSADGQFVHTGFKPAFVMVKNSSNPYTNWYIIDAVRNTYNATGLVLRPDTADAEQNYTPVLDFVSNGFKIRDTGAPWNNNGDAIIYMSFASNPFKYSLAR